MAEARYLVDALGDDRVGLVSGVAPRGQRPALSSDLVQTLHNAGTGLLVGFAERR
jgi:hypothetical protein